MAPLLSAWRNWNATRAVRGILATCAEDAGLACVAATVASGRTARALYETVFLRGCLIGALGNLAQVRTPAAYRYQWRMRWFGFGLRLRAALGANVDVLCFDWLQRAEQRLLERLTRATLDRRVTSGTAIVLERHRALVQYGCDRLRELGARPKAVMPVAEI